MTTASYSEGNYPGEFFISEANGTLSRAVVTVTAGQTLVSGAVLGRLAKRQAAAPIPAIVGTGTGLMSGLSFGPDVQVGSYVITLLATSATAAFSVVAPDSTALPNGAVATAYTSRHLSFTIANGGTMTVGDKYTVVVTSAGVPAIVGTGSGVMSGISLGSLAQLGSYVLTLQSTSGTAAITVTAPDGERLPDAKVGTAYTSSHINFTVADGGTMTVGDKYVIPVAAGTGTVSAYAPTAVDGTQEPYGILWGAVDASSAALPGAAIVRNAEVESAKLGWGTAVTAAQKASALIQLRALGIVAR
jgi:hypothetical protein